MSKRYHFLRNEVGCGAFTSAFIALLNEVSDLPTHQVGFMHIIWDMGK